MVSKERNLENAAFAWECMWRLSGHKCKRKPQGKRTEEKSLDLNFLIIKLWLREKSMEDPEK